MLRFVPLVLVVLALTGAVALGVVMKDVLGPVLICGFVVAGLLLSGVRRLSDLWQPFR